MKKVIFLKRIRVGEAYLKLHTTESNSRDHETTRINVILFKRVWVVLVYYPEQNPEKGKAECRHRAGQG